MDILKKYEEEIAELQNRLTVMRNKASTEEYAAVMARLMDLQDLYSRETERQKKLAEIEQKAKELLQKDEELDLQQRRLEQEADIEDKKLKAGRWQTAKRIGEKVIGGVVTAAVNLGLIYVTVRLNNAGETLTSFEQKFISPERSK